MNSVRELLKDLSEFSPEVVPYADNDISFVSVELITKSTVFRNDTLYIGLTSQVKNQTLNNINLFLVKDTENLSLALIKNNMIVEFPRGTCPNQLFKKCKILLKKRTSLLENAFILLNTFVDETDLEEIVDIASKLINNPLIVLDNSYKVLAFSKSRKVEDYQWKQNIKRGYCTYEYIAGFNSIEGVKNSPQSNQPFIINCFTSPLRRCISKLYLKNLQLGYVISIESNSPFEEMDMGLFTLISNLIAKTVSIKNRLDQNINNKAYDSILIDCLDGNFKSKTAFYERMQGTEFNTDSFYKILLIDISRYDNFDPGNEHLRTFIKKLFFKSWSICYKNNIVVLIDIHQKEYNIKEILEREIDFFKGNKLKIGISDTFSDLYDLSEYYRQATRALHIAKRINPRELFSNYDGYRFYDLIATAKKHDEIRSFYCSDFIKILKYDKKHDTQYFETVFQYLQHNRNLSKSAENLHIHKNTVSYRIRKIREIFNIDFDNTYKRFKLYYSYLIAKMVEEDIGQLINRCDKER